MGSRLSSEAAISAGSSVVSSRRSSSLAATVSASVAASVSASSAASSCYTSLWSSIRTKSATSSAGPFAATTTKAMATGSSNILTRLSSSLLNCKVEYHVTLAVLGDFFLVSPMTFPIYLIRHKSSLF